MEFTKFQKARMKRTAANVNTYLRQKNKLIEQINVLNGQLNEINSLIEVTDAPTKAITGGYGTEDIFYKVGNKWEFKYPDTIIPPIVGDNNDYSDYTYDDADSREAEESLVESEQSNFSL